MPTTVPTGFIYPDNNSEASINVAVAALAGSLEAKVGPYVVDSTTTLNITDSVNFGSFIAGGSVPIRRVGKTVMINGTLACKTAGYLNTTARRVIGVIPVGYRPSSNVVLVMQGSGTSRWNLEIYPNGNLTASRADGTQGANYWMPTSAMYFTD